MRLPVLSYSVNRSYPWPWFTPVLLGGIFAALCIVIPFEVALVGYNTITTSSKDFNAVPHHWWYHLWAKPKPGSLCTPANFTAGQTFTTTYGIFIWSIISTNHSDHSTPFIEYSGTNMDSCDIAFLEIKGNLLTSTVDLSAVVACVADDLPLLLRSSWSPWGAGSDLFSNILKFSANSRLLGPTAASSILSAASEDLFSAVLNSQNATAGQPVPFSFTLDFRFEDFCPKQFTEENLPLCKLNSTNNVFVLPPFQTAGNHVLATQTNGQIFQEQEDSLTFTYEDIAAINNLVPVLHSAVRLDLGYVLPTNVLTNAGIITVFNGDSNSSLYQAMTNQNIEYPVSAPLEAAIDVSFQCRYAFAKGAPELLFAVFVATFTVFMSGWGGVTFIASYFATKEPGTNYCQGHNDTLKEISILSPSISSALSRRSSFFSYRDEISRRGSSKGEYKIVDDESRAYEDPYGSLPATPKVEKAN